MIIVFEGREWQYDEDKVTVQQAMVLHSAYGLAILAWQRAIAELDPRAMQFCYWLMLAQNDAKPGPLKGLDFAVVEFIAAYRAAQEPAADEGEPEPDPTRPSPPDGQPSPVPSSPTGTTPAPRARREAATGS
jgi:hypothetical protein